ncbi:MAG: M67 family metallopeptidase [Bryobacterales bacterium]|nr:M67 family metallopeptidase [Bryobacterales bacterium]
MIKISPDAWRVMVAHAESAFPKECCGILLGKETGGARQVGAAIACRNAYEGEQKDRFQLDPKEQIAADRKAREMGVDILGFFHSHPDCDAYFSATDLKNSWPWYSNVVLSVQAGKYHHAKAFIANSDQTSADPEELVLP